MSKINKKQLAAIQAKFEDARHCMKLGLVDRDNEIDMLLTALLCGEHPLFVGDPGTAKSLMLDNLLEWLGDGTKFQVLFNRYTTPEEVFGPISVQGLKNDVYRRITTGKLPEADVAFADEIFKANSAILNTMLRILNERMYDNGEGTFQKVPLKICVAASNEWPNEQNGGAELGALFDRFLFRTTVNRVERSQRERLLFRRDHGAKFNSTLSTAELELAQSRVKEMANATSKEVQNTYLAILDNLNEKGIFPGDRRMFKGVQAAAAYAFLDGCDEVEIQHLVILQHVLWEDPTEQPAICADVCMKLANPTEHKATSLLVKFREVQANYNVQDQIPRLRDILNTFEIEVNEEENARCSSIGNYMRKSMKQALSLAVGQ